MEQMMAFKIGYDHFNWLSFSVPLLSNNAHKTKVTKQKWKNRDELVLILLPSYKISSEGVITPHHNTNNRPHEMIIISQNIALRFVDFYKILIF